MSDLSIRLLKFSESQMILKKENVISPTNL
jgi:hypothetical protein